MFARTERLMLRPGWLEDAPVLAAAMGDPSVSRNLTSAPHPYGLGDATAFLSRPQDPLLPELLVFTRTQGQPRLVGGAGLKRDEAGRTEIGYWIARPYWGLGFATEAARAVVQIARATGAPRLHACHAVGNPASGRVLRKIGFRPTGDVVPRWSAARGESVPCLLFEQDDGAMEGDGDAMILDLMDMQDRMAA